MFSALEKEQLLGKIVMMNIPKDLEAESILPSLPRLNLEGLFMGEKLPRVVTKLAPLSVGPISAVTTNGGLISPQSPARAGGRVIDPSLVCAIHDKRLNLLTSRFTAVAQTYVAISPDERGLRLHESQKILHLATNSI